MYHLADTFHLVFFLIFYMYDCHFFLYSDKIKWPENLKNHIFCEIKLSNIFLKIKGKCDSREGGCI